jgi:hypothetical protein
MRLMWCRAGQQQRGKQLELARIVMWALVLCAFVRGVEGEG